MKLNLQGIEASADHFGQSVASILKGLAHLVNGAAPVAEAIGTITGNPEVTAIAAIADSAANVVEDAVGAQSGSGSNPASAVGAVAGAAESALAAQTSAVAA